MTTNIVGRREGLFASPFYFLFSFLLRHPRAGAACGDGAPK